MDRRAFMKYGLTGIGGLVCMENSANIFSHYNYISPSDERFTCEPLYFQKLANGYACELCPNKCIVTDIRPGNCRTRYVKNDRFLCSAYGNPYYVNYEIPEKELLFHFLPGEKMLVIGICGCNLGCLNCNVSAISQVSPEEVRHQTLFPEQVIETCLNDNIKIIAYGYTEPVVFYEYMLKTAKLAHTKGIKNVFCSNGHINDGPLKQLAPFLDAAIIDVKAFSEASYQKLTGGSILPVFNTLKVLKEMKVWLEISHLLIPSWTDNFELIGKMCTWLNEKGFNSTPFHFTRFQPSYRLSHLNETSIEQLNKARKIAIDAGLQFVYLNIKEAKESLTTYCPKCKKEVAERILGGETILQLKNGFCKSCGEKINGIW
jgi:pyruvate formate lyase activating enzyme